MGLQSTLEELHCHVYHYLTGENPIEGYATRTIRDMITAQALVPPLPARWGAVSEFVRQQQRMSDDLTYSLASHVLMWREHTVAVRRAQSYNDLWALPEGTPLVARLCKGGPLMFGTLVKNHKGGVEREFSFYGFRDSYDHQVTPLLETEMDAYHVRVWPVNVR